MPAKSFDAIFADVPAMQKAYLQAFWTDYPWKEIVFEGIRWRYVRAGDARATLLLLPDAFTPADLWFRVTQSLASRYCIIAPSAHALVNAYDLDVVCAAYVRMLEVEGRYAASAVGLLEGGCLLQYMLQSYPHRIQNIVLGYCHPLGPQVKVIGASLLQRLSLRLLPWPLARKRLLEEMTAALPDSGAWVNFTRAYLELVMDDLERATVQRYVSETVPTYRRFRPEPRRMAGWDGEVLLFSPSDESAQASRLQELLRRYPQADTYIFDGPGEQPFLLYPDEAIHRLRAFLSRAHA